MTEPVQRDAPKRKRKRSKKRQTAATADVGSDLRVNRTNKKLKFDEAEPPALDTETTPQKHDSMRGSEGLSAPLQGPELLAAPQIPVVGPDSAIPDPEMHVQTTKAETTSPNGLLKRERKHSKRTFYDSDNDNGDDYSTQFAVGTQTRESLKERAAKLAEARKSLPIYLHREKIVDYITRNQVTVVIGETGSGKSTQIPQFLAPLNRKRLAVTQPRRVAAVSLAARVSEEYGCVLGQEVGYQVRFSNVTSPRTKINYLTDGMLIRELMLDPLLSKYSTVVIDEAHERTVLTDLILGLLKQLIRKKKRTDLKVVVMSATMNAELFGRFFDHAPILFVEGKMYPVTRHYLGTSSEDIVNIMLRAVVQVNMSEPEGDVLCFLPGQEEIDNCVSILSTLAPKLPKEAPMIVPLPLYAALSPGQQLKIFEKLPPCRRKVILATNIAETSITVSGVKYVIDSGLRKVKVWKHQLGLSTLLTTPISQASAKQRAGRAGRECAGKVFRLYSEKLLMTKLPKQQESEILRNDVVLPILTLKRMGVDDLLNWTWLEHPGRDSIVSALGTLYTLGALNDQGKVSALGCKMAIMPLPPALSAVLLEAFRRGVVHEVIDIVSCLSVDNLILNVGGNDELRDEVNYKRRQYCPLGAKLSDLIALKEFFDFFCKLNAHRDTAELKMWCKDLFFSYKGFRNVLKVKQQLSEYLRAAIKQDSTVSEHDRTQQLQRLQTQMERVEFDDHDEFADLLRSLNIEQILKSFLKGYACNTAIGMPDRSFRTCATGQLISIHPSSNLFGRGGLDAVMYIEYVYTMKAYGRNCSQIELAWLQEVAPGLLGGVRENINEGKE